MIEVKRYADMNKLLWNNFNKKSKNGLFMFDRDYMDYHSDRFTDHSLLFFKDSTLLAIMPLCEKDKCLISHGGLTFGGFITNDNMKQHTMNECFEALLDYSYKRGFDNITYKTIPHIYHTQPAEEDRYSLYAYGGKIITVDASTYISLRNPIKMLKGRKAQISRAKRENVEIKVLTDLIDFETFINVENKVLLSRHGVCAVHTGSELKLLHDRFPNDLHLFAAIKDDKLIGGVVIYEYPNVVHTQYMAANEEARTIGALDLTINTVIEKYRQDKTWLDFGISTEHGKICLNEGLISQKEGFGGRTGVYEIWNIKVK